MKVILKLLFVLIYMIVLLIVASCNTLDVEPQSSISAKNAFKNKKDVEKGILGAYASFQSLSYYGRTYSIFSDLSADNLSHPIDATAAEYKQVDNNNILPENSSISRIWSKIYDGINVANNVISKIPSIKNMGEKEKKVALAELYFIRALHHFNLLNYFEESPLKPKKLEVWLIWTFLAIPLMRFMVRLSKIY